MAEGSRAPPPTTPSPLVRLTLDELWTAFVRLGCSGGVSHFVSRCAAHTHFRLAGWLPRSGLQYGSDLVLYRNHPSLVHSDFCVVLQPSREVTLAAARAAAAVTDASGGGAGSVGGAGGDGGAGGRSDGGGGGSGEDDDGGQLLGCVAGGVRTHSGVRQNETKQNTGLCKKK